MPGFIGKKLCPKLVIVPGNYKKYQKESAILSHIFKQYDPSMQMSSLDEASLDITDFIKQRDKPGFFLICIKFYLSFLVKLKRVRYDPKNNDGCVCYLPLTSNICDNISNEKLNNCKTIEIFCEKCKKTRYSIVDYVEFGVEVEDVIL